MKCTLKWNQDGPKMDMTFVKPIEIPFSPFTGLVIVDHFTLYVQEVYFEPGSGEIALTVIQPNHDWYHTIGSLKDDARKEACISAYEKGWKIEEQSLSYEALAWAKSVHPDIVT